MMKNSAQKVLICMKQFNYNKLLPKFYMYTAGELYLIIYICML